MSVNKPGMGETGKVITPEQFRQKVEANSAGGTVNPFSNNPLMEKIDQQDKLIGSLHHQVMSLTTRFHAMLDYMSHAGMLLNESLDPDGTRTKVMDQGVMNIFEVAGLPKAEWPDSYDRWVEEHDNLTQVMVYLNKSRMEGRLNMNDVIEKAREYNNEEGRLRKMVGNEFGLDGYLALNPDTLDEEALLKLANEFGLVKMDVPEGLEDMDLAELEAAAQDREAEGN